MLPIVYFVFLFSCSALAKSENEALSVWWDPEVPSHSESLNSLMDGYGNDLLKVRPNFMFCCVCQEAIKRAKIVVYQKMTKKINHACNKYAEPFRKICIKRGMRYRDIILQKLFGGSPKGTCLKIKLC